MDRLIENSLFYDDDDDVLAAFALLQAQFSFALLQAQFFTVIAATVLDVGGNNDGNHTGERTGRKRRFDHAHVQTDEKKIPTEIIIRRKKSKRDKKRKKAGTSPKNIWT